MVIKRTNTKRSVRFTAEQRTFLLSLVTQPLTIGQIQTKCQKFKFPFLPSDFAITKYRQKADVRVKELYTESDDFGLNKGLALKANRIIVLEQLAQRLMQDMLPKDSQKEKLWLENWKGLGNGANFTLRKYEEFNHQEVIQLRGLLEDIAKEKNERNGKPNEGDNDEDRGQISIPAYLLAPDFIASYLDIQENLHTEYVHTGGRGSTKSSYVSLVFIELLCNNPEIHGLATRQIANTMRDSIYSQLLWAIDKLHLNSSFKCTTSPLEMEYLPTHQKIYFRGADDANKIKSIKPAFGHIGLLWFEELDQFHGPEAVRKIEQSVIRGGDEAWIFKSFNPPKTSGNWANKYIQIPKENQYLHKSSYITVPVKWLGQVFLDEAEHLKSVNPTAYDHEYLGIVNGMGGQVFDNVKIRKITDKEIAQFDRILRGNDWGYYPDPFAYVKMHYDAARLRLYIFDEYKANKKRNKAVYDDLVKLKGLQPEDLLIADSAEPKSIADFHEFGLNCRGAEKGPESVAYSIKWLQGLAEIVIDNTRAPNSATEFMDYELEQDKDGNYISEYPDKNNHFIDAARYGTNLIWRRRGQ